MSDRVMEPTRCKSIRGLFYWVLSLFFEWCLEVIEQEIFHECYQEWF